MPLIYHIVILYYMCNTLQYYYPHHIFIWFPPSFSHKKKYQGLAKLVTSFGQATLEPPTMRMELEPEASNGDGEVTVKCLRGYQLLIYIYIL